MELASEGYKGVKLAAHKSLRMKQFRLISPIAVGGVEEGKAVSSH